MWSWFDVWTLIHTPLSVMHISKYAKQCWLIFLLFFAKSLLMSWIGLQLVVLIQELGYIILLYLQHKNARHCFCTTFHHLRCPLPEMFLLPRFSTHCHHNMRNITRIISGFVEIKPSATKHSTSWSGGTNEVIVLYLVIINGKEISPSICSSSMTCLKHITEVLWVLCTC